MKIKKILSVFILSLLIFTCDNDSKNYIPYVPIYYKVDVITQMNLGAYESATITRHNDYQSVIKFPGNPVKPDVYIPYVTKGNGVLVFQTLDEYKVWDLTCTYRSHEDYCQTEYDQSTGVQYICPCCGSAFNLMLDAWPTDTSIAPRPLQEYSATEYGMELIISN